VYFLKLRGKKLNDSVSSGDKLPFSPDRIIAPGIAARVVSGALAGAALAPIHRRSNAAVLRLLTRAKSRVRTQYE
jgi:hypothetical protein